MMQISQGHLNTLEYCPRLFQYIYLDQFSIPLTTEQQTALARGSRFHMLMQQRELGLSTTVVGEDAALSELIERFLATAPEVMRHVGETSSGDRILFRQSEHRRQMVLQNFSITVVYDLLILETDRADIFDWKTGLGLPTTEKLERNWQFKLYPLVLAETSTYEPAHITMTYWFVQPDGPNAPSIPQKMAFPYNSHKHQAIYQELSQLLEQLATHLETYRNGRSLPQVDEISGQCEACPFAVRCTRTPRTMPLDRPFLNLDDISEVSI